MPLVSTRWKHRMNENDVTCQVSLRLSVLMKKWLSVRAIVERQQKMSCTGLCCALSQSNWCMVRSETSLKLRPEPDKSPRPARSASSVTSSAKNESFSLSPWSKNAHESVSSEWLLSFATVAKYRRFLPHWVRMHRPPCRPDYHCGLIPFLYEPESHTSAEDELHDGGVKRWSLSSSWAVQHLENKAEWDKPLASCHINTSCAHRAKVQRAADRVVKVGQHTVRLTVIINNGPEPGRAQLPGSSSTGPSSPKDSPAMMCQRHSHTSQSKLTSSVQNTNWEQQRKKKKKKILSCTFHRDEDQTPELPLHIGWTSPGPHSLSF